MEPTPDTLRQREYYRESAARYDAEHTDAEREHDINARWFSLFVSSLGGTTLLDVGTGTGRMLRRFKELNPGLRVVGVEPVEALRLLAYQHGLTPAEVLDGDACALPFGDGSFDFVCESAVLHHVREPQRAIREMLRVARIGILISDSNRFANGSPFARRAKYTAWKLGLWPAIDFFKSRGRGYYESVYDGIAYSFSVFDHVALIRQQCPTLHVFNPDGHGASLLFDAATVGLVALKPGFTL
ncbi:MAG TPA: methyltransferase domain-containing protein [Opitutaceae bacterium]|nr:methyltransferase domain-containing protein [Opitutaceae bacterium]